MAVLRLHHDVEGEDERHAGFHHAEVDDERAEPEALLAVQAVTAGRTGVVHLEPAAEQLSATTVGASACETTSQHAPGPELFIHPFDGTHPPAGTHLREAGDQRPWCGRSWPATANRFRPSRLAA